MIISEVGLDDGEFVWLKGDVAGRATKTKERDR